MRLKKISKRYGERRVLLDLSMDIACGEAVAITAPSGYGKTTLLRIILGLEAPDSGELTDVPDLISTVFQEDRLCDDLSAAANIRLVTNVRNEQITKCLSELGLGDDANTPVRSLSGGMKRRVAIARALLYGGRMIVMDEPLKGLDPVTKRQTAEVIQRYRHGRTIIVVTHDTEDIEMLGLARHLKLEEVNMV